MDEDLLPISALQHLAFCPRQCALIHLEQVWAENRLTVEGDLLHEKVKEGDTTGRGAVRTWRSLPLVSRRLRLNGVADVVEIHRDGDGGERAYPVEYKRGKPKSHDADRIQLCAQALCLEEMLGMPVPEGALFYGEPRRRETVVLDIGLRRRTEALAAELWRMIDAHEVPPPVLAAHCRSCSLVDICRPTLAGGKSAARWVEQARREA
jgi:CRISPR-associated exonuclease Cas4